MFCRINIANITFNSENMYTFLYNYISLLDLILLLILITMKHHFSQCYYIFVIFV